MMESTARPDSAVERQRDIQRQQLARDHAVEARPQAAAAAQGARAPIQTGQRPYPGELSRQSLSKPGNEQDLEIAPCYDAPAYRGSGKLEGMAALVTGGDSGIGRSVAILFAREGADVAIVYLNEREDAELTRQAIEAQGRRCVLIEGDVKDARFCNDAVARTVKELGKLDVLVNNAAFQEHADAIEDLSDARFDETMKTNIYGYFQMARAAAPHLRSGASIVNTGSVVGLEGNSHLLDYAMTKGAIHAFTKSLAQNLIERGIRVNAVAPGPVWTPLNPADAPADQMPKFGQHTDFRRAAQPEEIAPAYVFLASPVCASYINGIVLPITGKVGAI